MMWTANTNKNGYANQDLPLLDADAITSIPTINTAGRFVDSGVDGGWNVALVVERGRLCVKPTLTIRRCYHTGGSY